MAQQEITKQQSDQKQGAYHNALDAAKSLYERIPVGWRIALLGIIGFLTLLGFGTFHPFMEERVKFITANTLNLLIVLVVIIQAVIYHRQWLIMQEQSRIAGLAYEPRLRITDVIVRDLTVGGQPAFIIEIVNDGASDAQNVELQMRVNLREGERLAMKWSHPQIVTIPARQKESYFLAWRTALEQDIIDDINRGAPLKVSGHIRLPGNEPMEFCFMYYPWKGKRPKGMSQFIPCDFNPGLTHVMKAHKGEFKASGDVHLSVTKAIRQEESPSKDTGNQSPSSEPTKGDPPPN
jgi:hypothetical protein